MDYLCLFHFLEYLESLRNYFNVVMKLCGRVLTSALSEDSFAGSMSESMHNASLHCLTRCADRTAKELPLSFSVECPDVIHISFENQCHRRFVSTFFSTEYLHTYRSFRSKNGCQTIFSKVAGKIGYGGFLTMAFNFSAHGDFLMPFHGVSLFTKKSLRLTISLF